MDQALFVVPCSIREQLERESIRQMRSSIYIVANRVCDLATLALFDPFVAHASGVMCKFDKRAWMMWVWTGRQRASCVVVGEQSAYNGLERCRRLGVRSVACGYSLSMTAGEHLSVFVIYSEFQTNERLGLAPAIRSCRDAITRFTPKKPFAKGSKSRADTSYRLERGRVGEIHVLAHRRGRVYQLYMSHLHLQPSMSNYLRRHPFLDHKSHFAFRAVCPLGASA